MSVRFLLQVGLQIGLLVVFVTANDQQQKTSVSQCPANTFACKDGSCIPLDWVGDGEADCDNGADEKSDAKPRPTVFATNVTRHSDNGKRNHKISLAQDDAIYDPFDQISTKSATASTTLTTTAATVQQLITAGNATEEQAALNCPDDVKIRLAQCANTFLQWSANFNSKDFYNNSLLFDIDSLNELSRGCELLPQYRNCAGNLSITDCEINETVLLWSNVELYLCQLLLPSVTEHQKCFALAASPKCIPNRPKVSAEPLCELISSIGSYVNCIQTLSEGVCDERAIEVLEPFKTETANVFEDLRCRQPEKSTKTRISFKNDCLECSNPLYLLSNIDNVCKDLDVVDMWSAVRRTACDKKSAIQGIGECLKTVVPPEKCNVQPVNTLVCAALTQFNTNLECVKPAIDEQCSADVEAVVSSVQDSINDNIISQGCFALQPDYNTTNEEFSLNPLYPKCTPQQENIALACLVQLTELSRYMVQFQSLNFLMEISDENSTLVGRICQLYSNYSRCIDETVFMLSDGARCSFNLPLNTLARIGLSSMCENSSRELLSKNRECMENIKEGIYSCGDGLGVLGNAVNMMLQGIHGEALLCKSFYSIRKAFDCAEELVEERCSQEAGADILQLREQMTVLGIEEGCPPEEPHEIDEIISKQLTAARTVSLNNATSPPPQKIICEREEQKKFQTCVQPITNFQPHPLAVIKQPKLIDDACVQFKEFKECQAHVNCHPLWATGMSAMFEYACGPGYTNYIQIRQCIRKVTTREDIRDCVAVFSRGEPQHACQSSNTLLACARPLIAEKCGAKGDEFIKNYIEKFATAIDPSCKIGAQFTGSAIRTFNCTPEEDVLVQHCAASINELSLRMDELFQGGLQAFLANVKNLAPVFSQGCNLTAEFRQCARSALGSKTCMVSSCMIRAGDGICHRSNTAAAIDEHLECVFKQASNQEFSKCIRSTISTLSVFNLETLRSVLPQFVNCVEHIIIESCGQTPVNLLRALSSTDFCQVTAEMSPNIDCTSEMKQKHAKCISDFNSKYSMIPVGLIRERYDVATLCSEAEQVKQCAIESCMLSKDRGFMAMLSAACAKKTEFEKQSQCLSLIATSEAGLQCFEPYFNNHNLPHCTAMTKAIDCIGAAVLERCGADALEFSVDVMNIFSQQIGPCLIRIKSADAKPAECSENDLVNYLQCETATDLYGFTPVAYLKNASQWDEFCKSTVTYENCVSNMSCRIEPLTTGTLTLYKTLCGNKNSMHSAPAFAICLSQYISTNDGQNCLQPFGAVDLFTKEGAEMICSSINSALLCAESAIYQRCGRQALEHVYNTHVIWGQAFNKSCVLTKPPSLGVANEIIKPEEIEKFGLNKPDTSIAESAETKRLPSSSIPVITTTETTAPETDEIAFTTQTSQPSLQPTTKHQGTNEELAETTRTLLEPTHETEFRVSSESDFKLQMKTNAATHPGAETELQTATMPATTAVYYELAEDNLQHKSTINPTIKISPATEDDTAIRHPEVVNPHVTHNEEIDRNSAQPEFKPESTTTVSLSGVRATGSNQKLSPFLFPGVLLLILLRV